MKKIITLALMFFILAFINGFEAYAQTRIQFAKGKNSATVKGNTGSYGVYYVVRAKSGQKLILNLSTTSKVGIKIEVESAKGDEILLREKRAGTYEVGLEESGDNTILIGSPNGKSVSYTLTVKVTALSDI